MDSRAIREPSSDFYRYLSTEKDLSPNTRRAYEGDIRDFLAFLDRNRYEDVDHKAIRAYVAEVYGSLKKSSLSRKISSIKVFFKFLKKKGHITENPAVLIKNPRIEKHLPKFYTVDEMFHFLDTLPGQTWIALRNKAIFELIYSTGMRAQEALDLDTTDIHLEGLWALVKGKGERSGSSLSARRHGTPSTPTSGRSGRGGRIRSRPSSSTDRATGSHTGAS